MFPIDLTKPCDKKKKEKVRSNPDALHILSVGRDIGFPSNSISDNFVILEGDKKLSRCFISFHELERILIDICNSEEFYTTRSEPKRALYRQFLAEAYAEDFDCIDSYNMEKYFKHLLYNLRFVNFEDFI